MKKGAQVDFYGSQSNQKMMYQNNYNMQPSSAYPGGMPPPGSYPQMTMGQPVHGVPPGYPPIGQQAYPMRRFDGPDGMYDEEDPHNSNISVGSYGWNARTNVDCCCCM